MSDNSPSSSKATNYTKECIPKLHVHRAAHGETAIPTVFHRYCTSLTTCDVCHLAQTIDDYCYALAKVQTVVIDLTTSRGLAEPTALTSAYDKVVYIRVCDKMKNKAELAPYVMHVPLNVIAMSDADFVSLMCDLLLPIACETVTNSMIVVSDDEIKCARVTLLIHLLATFCAGRIHAIQVCTPTRLSKTGKAKCNIISHLKSVLRGNSPRLLNADKEPVMLLNETPTERMTAVLLDAIEQLFNMYVNVSSFWPRVGDDRPTSPSNEWPCRRGINAYEDCMSASTAFTQNGVALDNVHSAVKELHPNNDKNRDQKAWLYFDERFLLHLSAQQHPENPHRMTTVFWHLNQTSLTHFPNDQRKITDACIIKKARQATNQELLAMHSQHYIDKLSAICAGKYTPGKNEAPLGRKGQYEVNHSYNSIFLNENSESVGRLAAGATIDLVDSIINTPEDSNEPICGFCLVRPPGHHAEHDASYGFCLYNNVALAARNAELRRNTQRILIFDWDVHHGNGVQHMFEESSNVLYVSLHRYDDGTFFPAFGRSGPSDVGRAGGTGFTVNIALNRDEDTEETSNKRQTQITDVDFMYAMLKIVIPITLSFAPTLVIVASGFDAALGDPLGDYGISPWMFHAMSHIIRCLANGRLAHSLEGGYNLVSLSESVEGVIRSLVNQPPPLREYGRVHDLNPLTQRIAPCVWSLIRRLSLIQSEFWPILNKNKHLRLL